MLGVGIEKHIGVQEKRGHFLEIVRLDKGLEGIIEVRLMESKYKRTSQEGSVAMP